MLAHLVLWRRRRLQEVHRWRLGRVVLGEGHPQAELLPGVDGAFRPADGDNPHSDRTRAEESSILILVKE